MVGRKGIGIAVLGVALGLTASAGAATTPLGPGSADGPFGTIPFVLGQAYGYFGGPSSGTVGTSLTYSSGANSLTFTRIQDSGGSSGNLLLDGSNLSRSDAQWQDGTPTFAVEVKFAALGETLGWLNLNTATSQDILNVTSSGFTPPFTTINTVTSLSSDFLWYDTAGANTWFSDPALNGGEDHMITFWVNGTAANGAAINGGAGAFVIAFEDLPFATSDTDYNDLVVQVAEVAGGSVVPVPPALWGGLGLLGLLAGARAWRRHRM